MADSPSGKLHWIGSGCDICDENAAASPIGFDDEWPNPGPPCHPSCDCSVEWEWDDGEGGGSFPPAKDWQLDTGPGVTGNYFSKAADSYMDDVLTGDSEVAQRIQDDELDRYEERALDYYQGDGFRKVNGALREGEEMSEKVADTVHEMDRLIGAQSFEEDTVVFRGVRDSKTVKFSDLKPGDRFSDAGYTSSSVFHGVADKTTAQVGTVMQMVVPKGTNGLYLSGFGEGELILPRGLVFEVIQAGDDVMKVRIVL